MNQIFVASRPQEKPAPPPPAPSVAAPTPAPAPSAPTPLPNTSAPEPEFETPDHGWEEPTTVQSPTWDDEPASKPSTSITDVWSSTSEVSEEAKAEELLTPQGTESSAATSLPDQTSEEQAPVPKSEPELPAVQVAAAAAVTATPSPKLTARPTSAAHRTSAKYKTIDQPVVMPSSFGSGIEKVGMQFGSLSLGGESLFDTNA